MVTQYDTLKAFFGLSPQTRKLLEREIMRDPHEPVSITEAAAICGCSVDTLKRLEKDGKIGPIRRNRRGHRLYSDADLRAITVHQRRG